jgi:hypothetical protein
MKILKTLIPRQVIAAGRLLQVFLSGYGHSRRVSGMPVDGHGHFIPWLTRRRFDAVLGQARQGSRQR